MEMLDASLLEEMKTKHKKYRRSARILYRFLIIICTVALILAILGLYLLGKLDGQWEVIK